MIERETLKPETKRLIVECVITLHSGDNGGRVTPPTLNGGIYRTLLQTEDVGSPDLFGVIFITGPSEIEFGVEATVELLPVIYPNPAYDALRPGTLFVIREGERLVGRGRVLRRSSD